MNWASKEVPLGLPYLMSLFTQADEENHVWPGVPWLGALGSVQTQGRLWVMESVTLWWGGGGPTASPAVLDLAAGPLGTAAGTCQFCLVDLISHSRGRKCNQCFLICLQTPLTITFGTANLGSLLWISWDFSSWASFVECLGCCHTRMTWWRSPETWLHCVTLDKSFNLSRPYF